LADAGDGRQIADRGGDPATADQIEQDDIGANRAYDQIQRHSPAEDFGIIRLDE
jgi:hypothetical protein